MCSTRMKLWKRRKHELNNQLHANGYIGHILKRQSGTAYSIFVNIDRCNAFTGAHCPSILVFILFLFWISILLHNQTIEQCKQMIMILLRPTKETTLKVNLCQQSLLIKGGFFRWNENHRETNKELHKSDLKFIQLNEFWVGQIQILS